MSALVVNGNEKSIESKTDYSISKGSTNIFDCLILNRKVARKNRMSLISDSKLKNLIRNPAKHTQQDLI